MRRDTHPLRTIQRLTTGIGPTAGGLTRADVLTAVLEGLAQERVPGAETARAVFKEQRVEARAHKLGRRRAAA